MLRKGSTVLLPSSAFVNECSSNIGPQAKSSSLCRGVVAIRLVCEHQHVCRGERMQATFLLWNVKASVCVDIQSRIVQREMRCQSEVSLFVCVCDPEYKATVIACVCVFHTQTAVHQFQRCRIQKLFSYSFITKSNDCSCFFFIFSFLVKPFLHCSQFGKKSSFSHIWNLFLLNLGIFKYQITFLGQKKKTILDKTAWCKKYFFRGCMARPSMVPH